SNATTTARLAVNYLIFDGGARRAGIDAADATARAALGNYADTAQALILNLVTTYNALAGNRAIEDANVAQVKFAAESRDLAAARARAGVATSADRLQAETALAQAELTLIQTRANVATSLAQLAVAVGLPPTTRLDLAPAPALADGARLLKGADALIADAERARPDILAAKARIASADANIRSARSAGRPSLSVAASNALTAVDTSVDRNLATVGLTLSVPVFSGWNTRYNIAAAAAQAEQQRANAEQTRQQAGLSVYSAYVALEAALAGLKTAGALVASATESASLTQGRYKAGTGTFADLLNAQSALAQALQSRVQAEFNVRTADAQLARAVGSVGDAIGERVGDAGGER
ncbi:TolC family protein, partial [Sandarakinorhabdus sp.]|uniref:TolC family protein n=1 Tax=Sandarakinorhabdus sp. TaxID=1916663 RepID=UPI00286EAB99